LTPRRRSGTSRPVTYARRPWASLLCALGAALVGCASDPPAPVGACASAEVVVAASDYTSSALGSARGRGPQTLTTGFDLGKDPQLTEAGGRLFFLARDTDLVFELDRCGTPIGRVSLAGAAGAGATNPHDVAVAPDGALWATLYNRGAVAISREGRVARTIDLSAYDEDGNPQADAIRIVDVDGAAKAFVTLERLDDRDRLRSLRPSQMLVVDVATEAPEATFTLLGRNPFNRLVEHAGRLLIAAPGNFDDGAEIGAGIEAFDVRTRTSRMLVEERDLAGSVAEISVEGSCGVAIVAGPLKDINPTWLVTFDASTGKVLAGTAAPLFGPTPGYDLQGLAWRGDRLYVGDRRRGAGGHFVRVFRRVAGECRLELDGPPIELPLPAVGLR
jgi:hypothetical protein